MKRRDITVGVYHPTPRPSPASAAESEGGKKPAVSEAPHKVLTEARALIGKHQPREAIEKLAALLPTLAKEPYALAVTHQVMGYAYGDQDGLPARRRVLQEGPVLPGPPR